MDIKILEGISINQNVIILALSYIGIFFAADNPNLQYLSCLCWLIFTVAAISTITSLIIYSAEYWTKKYCKAKTYRLKYKVKQQYTQEKNLSSDDITKLFPNKV